MPIRVERRLNVLVIWVRRLPAETVAKRRENRILPHCHATHGHSPMPIERVLQQSPQQPDSEPGEGAHPKIK